MVVRAELIPGACASMHGPSYERLGCGTEGRVRSDILGPPAAHQQSPMDTGVRLVASETLWDRPPLGCRPHASRFLCRPKNSSGVGPVAPTLLLSAWLRCERYAILRMPYLVRILVRRSRAGHGHRTGKPRNRLSAGGAQQSVSKASQWRILRRTDQGTLL